MATKAAAEDYDLWVAKQEALAEVETELREQADGLSEAELYRLAQRLLARNKLTGHPLVVEFRGERGKVERRVSIRAGWVASSSPSSEGEPCGT